MKWRVSVMLRLVQRGSSRNLYHSRLSATPSALALPGSCVWKTNTLALTLFASFTFPLPLRLMTRSYALCSLAEHLPPVQAFNLWVFIFTFWASFVGVDGMEETENLVLADVSDLILTEGCDFCIWVHFLHCWLLQLAVLRNWSCVYSFKGSKKNQTILSFRGIVSVQRIPCEVVILEFKSYLSLISELPNPFRPHSYTW